MTVTDKGHQQSLGVTMDQSIPIELLPNDRLSSVVNSRVRKPGGQYKRYGYTSYNRNRLLDDAVISTGKRFIPREGELAFTDGNYLYSYANGLNKWVLRDRMPECQVFSRQEQVADIQKGTIEISNVAHLLGQTCVAYLRLIGADLELWARVFRDDTLIAERRLLNSADDTLTGSFDLITCGAQFVIVFGLSSDGGTISAFRWDTVDITNPDWVGPTVLVSDADGSNVWAVAEIPALAEFALGYRTTTGTLDVYRFDATLASTDSAVNQRAGKAFDMIGLKVISTTLTIAIENTTDGTVEAFGLVASTLNSAFAPVVVLATTTDIAGPLIVGERTSLSAWVMVRSLGTTSTPFLNQPGIRYRAVGVPSGTVDANTYDTYNCRHISHIWNYNGQSYVIVYPMVAVFDLTQPAWIVVNLGADEVLAGDADYRARPVARWGEGEAYATQDTFPTHVPAGATTGTFLAGLIRADNEFQKLGISRGVSADVVTLNFDDNAATRWVGQCQIGGDALIPGGMLHCYDGELCFEAGWTYYPLIREAIPFVTVNPGIPTGVLYEYVVCFVKRDKQGRIWRSRPSLPATGFPDGDLDNAIRLLITHYSITSMHDSANGFAHPPGIEVYRRVGSAPFIRLAQNGVAPSNVAPPSDPTSQAYFVFEDDGTWTTANQPELYTTGGVLENHTPRPCRYSAIFDNRLFISGCDDDEVIQYSREIVGHEGAFFNIDQEFRIDEGQGVKALAVQDSSLLLLKDDNDGIFYIQGFGPNDFGQDNGYTEPKKVANAHGCIEPRSVLTTNRGTFFRSRRGIELIGRGEGVQLFGDKVEDTLALLPTITSCRYEPDAGEIRWTLTDGTNGQTVVFTEPTETWARDVLYGGNGLRAQDAAIVGGIYHWLGPDGYVYREDSNYYDISTQASLVVAVASEITTGDIALAGPLGKVSHFRVALLGKRVGSHGLFFTIYLDQGQTLAASKSFTEAEVNAFKWFPIELPVVNLTTQQARSIRISVTDVPTGEIGSGPIWFWLLVEYGSEREYQQLPVPVTNRK